VPFAGDNNFVNFRLRQILRHFRRHRAPDHFVRRARSSQTLAAIRDPTIYFIVLTARRR